MFKCKAGHTSQPREKEHKVATRTRLKDYFNSNKTTTGFETVEETSFCKEHKPNEE